MNDAPRAPTPTAAGLGATLWWLVVGQVALHAGMSGQRMATPLQALQAGHSAWTVGLLLALFAAVPVVTAMASGRLVDRRGYHEPQRLAAWCVVAGAGCAVLSVPVAGVAAGAAAGASGPAAAWAALALQCVGAGLSGAGAHLGLIAIQRTAASLGHSPTERLRIFAWLGLAPSLANMIGPVLAGLAIDGLGYAGAYGLMLALPLVSLAVRRRVPAHLSVSAPPPLVTQGPEQGAWQRMRELLMLPGMRGLLLVNWLLSASWDVHSFAVPVLGHERGFSASTIGLVLGAFTAAITGVRLVVPFIAERLREASVLFGAMLGVGVAFAVYPLANAPLAVGACAVLLGLALGAVQPMIMNALHLLTPAHRQGEALAMRSMAINLSSSLMPLAFGAVGAAIGAGALFWVMAVLVVAGSGAARGLTGVLAQAHRAHEAPADGPQGAEPASSASQPRPPSG